MTNESELKSTKGRIREMGFSLGPPTGDGWKVSDGEPSSESPKDTTQSASSNTSAEMEDAAQTTSAISIDDAAQQFATRLQLLLTYRREVATVARATSLTNSMSIFALFSEMVSASRNRKKASALASFSVEMVLEDQNGDPYPFSVRGPIYEAHHVKAVRDRLKYHGAALRLLYETTVQQLVNSYERLIGDIARSHILDNTEAAATEQSLTYAQILDFASLDEVKRAVVEAQVTDLIRNRSTLEQLQWLQTQLKIDVRAQGKGVDAFRGLELRRHAIVHAGGIATSEYLRRLRQLGEQESAPEGKPLELSSTYIENAWDVVYALGIVTVHLAAVARARRRSDDPEGEDRADGQLNAAAFWAIEQRRYQAAEVILEYANARRLSKSTWQLMVLVNLAQTYKWQGRDEDCRQLLSKQDWEAASDQFRLCVAVLKGEDPERYLARAVGNDGIGLSELYEWPVFSEFRKHENFPAVVERVFGPDATRPLEKFPPSLLDFSHKETLRKLFEHLEGLAREAMGREGGTDEVGGGTVH